MKARYKYRIYPTDQQCNQLAQVFGCARVVYNDSLALCHKSLGGQHSGETPELRPQKLPKNSELQKICITQAKKTEERSWLKDVSVVALQQSIIDLGTAWSNYFNFLSGKRKGRKLGKPRFKRRHNQQSIRFTKRGFTLKHQNFSLAKVGQIKIAWSRKLPTEPSSVTIIKDTCNRYFASFVVEVQAEIVPAQNESIGVDLGIQIFAALSNDEKIYAPDYKTLDRKIRRNQRRLSRQIKGSNRREKTRLKVAKLKAKVAAIRKDFLHKLSTKLVKENQIISLEDLNVSGMVKNRRLARAISQAGWGMFRTMCEAKSNKFLRDVRVIERWQPTSQICADCGYKWGKLNLSIREIVCFGCSKKQCRDGNASRVIDKVGLGHSHNGDKWTGSECQTAIAATRVELSTRLVEDNGQLCLPI